MGTSDTTGGTAAGPSARYGIPGCVNCGPVELYPVFDGELTNFSCAVCGTCWHFTLGFMIPVQPETCPGCQLELQCRERHSSLCDVWPYSDGRRSSTLELETGARGGPTMLSTVRTKVKDVATRETVVVPPQTTLRVAAEVMSNHAIGAVVIAVDRRVVGIVSERDVVIALAAGADPDEATVAGAMSHDIVSVRPDDTLYDAAVDMLDLGIRHVPVLNDRGAALGMVSVRDLLRPLLTASLGH